MSVRRSMRKASLRGTQAWARVESVALSAATVRLAEGGARLTNLQMMAPVRVGEKVIVDFVAQDKPTVRPYTTTVDLLIEDEVLSAAPKIPSDPDPDAGEPKLSSQLIAGEITKDEEFTESFDHEADREPEEDTILQFPFTYVYYDWGHQFYDGGLYIKYPGRYMMSLRIAANWVDDPDYWAVKIGVRTENTVGWSFDDRGIQQQRWHDYQPGGIIEVVWQGSMTFSQGTVVRPVFSLFGAVDAGSKWMVENGGCPITFPYYPGRYPIFQWWRICPMAGPRSVLYWWDIDGFIGTQGSLDHFHY